MQVRLISKIEIHAYSCALEIHIINIASYHEDIFITPKLGNHIISSSTMSIAEVVSGFHLSRITDLYVIIAYQFSIYSCTCSDCVSTKYFTNKIMCTHSTLFWIHKSRLFFCVETNKLTRTSLSRISIVFSDNSGH